MSELKNYKKSVPSGGMERPSSSGGNSRYIRTPPKSEMGKPAVTSPIVVERTIEGFNCTLDKNGRLVIRGKGIITDSIRSGIYEMERINSVNVNHIQIEEGITAIANDAFKCTSAKRITFPASLTHIGGGAFMMSDLEQITIPNSVTSIGEWVFESCIKLKKVVMPARFDKALFYRGFNIFSPLESYTGFENYFGIPKSIVTFV